MVIRALSRAVSRGSRRSKWRAAPAAAAAALLVACVAHDKPMPGEGPKSAAARDRLLVPLRVIAAARVAPSADPTGTPVLRAPAAPLTPLISPAAVALARGEFYIADVGARKLYRLDAALSMMTVVAAAPVSLGTRIAVGEDLSLYVLDPPNRRVLRLSRGGKLLATYADELNLTRPTAFAVDDAHGEVWVADQVFNILVAFQPLGHARQVVSMRGDERNRVLSITAIALGAGVIYISDALCRCVQVVDRGGYAIGSFGHAELGQPGAIALDRHGRVFVVDEFHNSVKMYASGRLVHESRASSLGVARIVDIAINEDRLMVADGAGARAVVLRIPAPGAGA